jgi:hypothetical protein
MPFYDQVIPGEVLPQRQFRYRTRRPTQLPPRVWGGVIAIVGLLWLIACSNVTSTPVCSPGGPGDAIPAECVTP